MIVCERGFSIPYAPGHKGLLSHLEQALRFRLPKEENPLRLTITETTDEEYRCEIGVLKGLDKSEFPRPESIFHFARRIVENAGHFNAVLIVPTGVGAEIGGHAGDAMPVARLLAGACDLLVTHPNVVNASDLNEIPDNALYIEGSVLSRLLMGTVGLQPVRSNRVLVVIDAHENKLFSNAAINAVSAARSSYGFNCPRVVELDPPVKLRSQFTESGCAAGEVRNLEYLFDVLSEYRDEYDAIAISSVIDVPPEYHQEYFDRQGEMVNPWGGVEAMLTHAISEIFNVPSAHSPMFESADIANMDPGVVDPRMAAEAISLTFLQCIFKGLQRSPRIVVDEDAMRRSGVFTAEDVSCVVIPDGCLGLPTLAALEQGIPVIAVRENKNLMRNNLMELPWAPSQLHIVENYWEAVGVMGALRAGIAPESVRRPLAYTTTERRSRDEDIKKRGTRERKKLIQ